MKIVMIGAGGLASNLAPALCAAGHDVVAVYSRTIESASLLAQVVGAEPTDNLSSLPTECDCFILAVKDVVLTAVITQLAKGRDGQLFVHTAGSMPMSLFEGYVNRYGVLWPMQTFSRERHVSFGNVPVFLEASDCDTMMMLQTLAMSITNSVWQLSSEERKYMHLAAVFACNFANHCYTLAAQILKQHGLPFSIMQPLIAETAHKVQQLHPAEAQTGPAVRYDENVISSQAKMLACQPEIQRLYLMLSESIHKTATNR